VQPPEIIGSGERDWIEIFKVNNGYHSEYMMAFNRAFFGTYPGLTLEHSALKLCRSRYLHNGWRHGRNNYYHRSGMPPFKINTTSYYVYGIPRTCQGEYCN
jgi:hypothetical protein